RRRRPDRRARARTALRRPELRAGADPARARVGRARLPGRGRALPARRGRGATRVRHGRARAARRGRARSRRAAVRPGARRHAWVEAWFPRWGWVPFDPTPGRGTLDGAYTSASPTFDYPAVVAALGGTPLGASLAAKARANPLIIGERPTSQGGGAIVHGAPG